MKSARALKNVSFKSVRTLVSKARFSQIARTLKTKWRRPIMEERKLPEEFAATKPGSAIIGGNRGCHVKTQRINQKSLVLGKASVMNAHRCLTGE